MNSDSLLASLIQLAERSKRNLRAAPGQIADQFNNFISDWQATSAAVPTAVKSSAGRTDEEVFKKAIEETAGNAIPGGSGVAGIFAGPQGIARLKAAGLGDKMKEFTSRFFGQRAEINPTDTDLVIQAMLGGPHAVVKAKQAELKAWKDKYLNLAKQAVAFPNSAGLQEAVAKNTAPPKELVAADFLENFPELVIAYPRLKEVPVDFYPSIIRGVTYAGKFDPEYVKRVNYPYGKGLEAENAFYSAMGTQRFGASPELQFRAARVNKMAQRRAKIKAREDSLTGNITVISLPGYDVPGVDSYNTILHEIQHFIQREEAGLGKKAGAEFLDVYRKQKDIHPYGYDKLVDKVNATLDSIGLKEKRVLKLLEQESKLPKDKKEFLLKQLDQLDYRRMKLLDSWTTKPINTTMHTLPTYEYNMNPFEREAYEAAKRDTNPAYRKTYNRKTEVIK